MRAANVGKVKRYGYRWKFGIEDSKRLLIGTFPPISANADLYGFTLNYYGRGRSQFHLSNPPEGQLISLVISVKFCNVDDQSYKFQRWKVTNLNELSRDLTLVSNVLSEDGRGPDTKFWPKFVTIRKVNRTDFDIIKASSICLRTKPRVANPSSIAATKVVAKRTKTRQTRWDSKKARIDADSVDMDGEDSTTATVSHSVSKNVGGEKNKSSAAVHTATTSHTHYTRAQSQVAQSTPECESLDDLPILVTNNYQPNAESVSTAPLQSQFQHGQSTSAANGQIGGDSQIQEKMSQLREANLRLITTQAGMQLKLVQTNTKLNAKSEELDNVNVKLTLKTESFDTLQTQMALMISKAEQSQKHWESFQSAINAKQSELNKVIEDLNKLNEQNLDEISRQSILIEEKSKSEENLQAKLSEKESEVERLSATLNQLEIDQVNKYVQNNRAAAEANLPAVNPDFNPVCSTSRPSFSPKSPVFKSAFSPNSAKIEGLLELLKFLFEQNFSADLSTVAVELQSAAEHYQLQWDKLMGICEEELINQLSFKSLSSIILLANQLESDRLMTKCFVFVKRENSNSNDNDAMWADLQLLSAKIPKLFRQICAFSESAENAELPEFHYSSITNRT